jgi:hypothetical protein
MTQSYPGGEFPSPLPEAETPPPMMMANPVLTRRGETRRSAHMAWYVGVPVAVVALGALAFVITGQMNQPSLLSNDSQTTTTTTAQTAPPAAAPVPVPAPAPAPAQVATAAPTETPVAPPPEITPRPTRTNVVRHVTHRAPSASESGADVSATAPQTLTPPAEAAPATPAPAPAAPPTITPPPN